MVTFLKITLILDRNMIKLITNSHVQMSLAIELPPTAEHYLIPLPNPPMVICGMQYVGETESALHTRVSSHHSDNRTKKQVATHSNTPDQNILGNLEVMVIGKYIRTIAC